MKLLIVFSPGADGGEAACVMSEFHPWAVGMVDRVSVDDQHCDSDLEESKD